MTNSLGDARLAAWRKHGNIPTAGYASKKESEQATILTMRQRAGDIKGWDSQVRIPLEVAGKPLRIWGSTRQSVYVADFVVRENDGSTTIIEVKGAQENSPRTSLWKLKLGLVQLMWPEVKIDVV